MSVPTSSVTSAPPQQWVARLKMEPNTGITGQTMNTQVVNSVNSVVNAINSGATFVTSGGQNLNAINIQNLNNALNMQQGGTATLSLASMESYEEVFKEITKKLYGDESLAEVIDSSGNIQQANIIYESDNFRTDGSGSMTFVTAPNGALPPGTIVLQRKIHQDKDGRLWASVDMPQSDQIALATAASSALESQQQLVQAQVVHTTTPSAALEERWFESDEVLNWTVSKIARYNPSQKVFRCVDCDFVGFLSRVAEHWLGNHASLRVFQCPRCPYTSAWARCVRMHLTKQHGETLTDNSLWKENPVLEEWKTQVTKFLTTLKTRVEQKGEASLALNGERRYTCPYCPYATDRRDLFNRHENIHRETKPFQCYVCDKQFNRADHVKKHFTRMHRDHPYDINKIKKHFPKTPGGVVPYHNSKMANSTQQQNKLSQDITTTVTAATQQMNEIVQELEHSGSTVTEEAISLQLDGNHTVTVQQIPHIAYFNPPSTPGQTGPLQGIAGVGGTKKESKSKGQKKKKSGEKMFTCSYCPWQGVDNWCLKRHLNTHIKPFLCALCDYKAARSERLATHVLKVHNKRVCHKCSFLADDTESLSQHIQDSHQNPLVKTGFNCNVCQEYFELRADLEAHAILEHQKVIVQCDLCDFRTTDELSMEAHLRDKHNLQPGMGAVAAAAAAAAAAAIGQPTSTQYQMQLPTQSQMQLQDPMTGIQQGNLDHQNLLLTSEQLNQSNIAATVAAVASGDQMQFHQELGKLDTPQSQQNDVHHLQSSLPIEPELEPETLCDKCGIEFADEASLKLHEKRHELESQPMSTSVKDGSIKPAAKKPLLRSYTCSTCSYTASTKKIMMQHQRAHNGLELICKAEGCMFSTPFDNTLKEHIHTEHGTEPNVRCPHCGLRIPSTNAFTYHWRAHHSNLCSLCVNLYRIKYGIKENDLHDLISKSMVELLNDDLQPKSKPVIQIQDNSNSTQMEVDSTVLHNHNQVQDNEHQVNEQKIESQEESETQVIVALPSESTSIADADTQIIDDTNDDSTKATCTPQDALDCMSNNNNEYPSMENQDAGDEPLAKKRRLEPPELTLDFTSVLEALQRKNARESLKLIPNIKEVLVIPVISEKFLKTFAQANADWSTSKKAPQSNNSKPVQIQKKKGRKVPNNSNGRVLKLRQVGFFGSKEMRLLPLRRYIGRGTKTWLRRHFNGGVGIVGRSKCHSWMCQDRSKRYSRRSGLSLHNLWFHSSTPYHCDSCTLSFEHLYQAYLHKLRDHSGDPNSNLLQNVTKHPPVAKYIQQQIIITGGEEQDANLYQEEHQHQMQIIDSSQHQQLITGFKAEIH